jgi:UDP-N-acetylmuramate: L-alanyl-gamma-D-glutamyl-meso-diaminopimelate ligase
MEPKHIHFIGICGVAMSALAIAFKNAGWHVTGSDVGFFPPISTYLEKNNIAFYPGWHVEKMIARGTPDLIVVGNVAGSTNPEFVFAQTNNLHYKSYPEVVAEYIVAQHSLVCAGTYGKTSSAALLTYILQQNGFDPSYMFGGLSSNIPDSAHINSNKEGWSVLEGDEYKTARWDNRPKFALYSPTHLLLTALSWDHADVYPTEESYINAFKSLLASVPENGLIVACTDAEKITELTTNAATKARVISYGKNKTAEYRYDNISQTTDGLHFNIYHNTQEYTIHSAVLGAHMAENICGAFAMAAEIGIDTNIIVQSIANFKGIKRRLEKKYEGFITIYDDLAHSPAKASATLKTLKFIYPTNNIIAIFEPNTGNRKSQSIPGYAHAFVNANEVIIPTLTKLKVDEKDTDPPFDGRTLCDIIAKNHTHALYIENDPALLAYIKEHAKKEDVVVFLGSHGFRGMIDELVRSYEGK